MGHREVHSRRCIIRMRVRGNTVCWTVYRTVGRNNDGPTHMCRRIVRVTRVDVYLQTPRSVAGQAPLQLPTPCGRRAEPANDDVQFAKDLLIPPIQTKRC